MACIKTGTQLDRDRNKWEAHLLAEGLTPTDAAMQADMMATNSAILTRRKKLQQALLSAQSQASVKKIVEGAKDGGEAADLLDALSQRNYKGVANELLNTVSAKKTVHAVARSYLAPALEVAAKAERMSKGERLALDHAVRLELWNTPSGNPLAKQFADSFTKAADYTKAYANWAGMDIRTLSDWRYPRRWDGEIVGNAKDEFVSLLEDAFNKPGMMKPLVDEAGTPILGAELHDVLDGIADNIRTGNVHGTIGELPGAMKSRHRQPRVLGFLNRDFALAMEDKFGAGDIISNGISHVEGLANEGGTMKLWGPNPDRTYAVGREAAARKGASVTRLNASDRLYLSATGASNRAADPYVAKIGRTLREFLSSALLPLSLASQLTDVVPRGLVAASNGVPFMRDLGEFFSKFTHPLTPAAIRELTAVGVDAEVAINRLADEGALDVFHAVGKMNQFTMTWSGTKKWNRVGSITTQQSLLRGVAENAGKDFARADAAMGGKLTQYGYTPATWDTVRTHGVEVGPGGLKTASVRALEEARTAGTIAPKEANDAMQRLIHHVGSETDLAMTIPQAGTRAGLALGTRPGTYVGEAIRSLTQFKSFPAQFAINHVGELLRKSGGDRVKHASALLLGTVALGMVGMQAKRLLKGQGLADMSDPHNWVGAAAQGGGLGIIGDFASSGFGSTNRFGQDPLTALLGPAFGFTSDAIKLTTGNVGEVARGERANIPSELGRFVGRYTPALNLPFMGLAAQRLIIDQLRLMADPSGTRRSFMTMEQRQRQEYGAKDWWRHGQTLPEAMR